MLARELEGRLREELAEVDDGVEEDAVAERAFAAGEMVGDGLVVGGDGAEVWAGWGEYDTVLSGKVGPGRFATMVSLVLTTQILLATVPAVLQITVPMKLGYAVLTRSVSSAALLPCCLVLKSTASPPD